jgi:hypothetical protein
VSEAVKHAKSNPTKPALGGKSDSDSDEDHAPLGGDNEDGSERSEPKAKTGQYFTTFTKFALGP